MGLKKIIGDANVEFRIEDGATFKDLIDTMIDHYGEKMAQQLYVADYDQILSHYRLMVNGRDLSTLNGFATVLNEDDEIILFPHICGG